MRRVLHLILTCDSVGPRERECTLEEDVEFETMKLRDDFNRFMDTFEESGSKVGLEADNGDFMINASMVAALSHRLYEMAHETESDDRAGYGLHFAAFLIADLLEASLIRASNDFDISFIVDEDEVEDDE